jgi:EAL domain-containing protein (putative c-di-GMP-specific phosphodiesterase class I)
MYHAKERGRDGYQFYSRGIHDLALDRLTLEKDLKQAIASNALTLVFQPKVNLATGQVSGCETLVRWHHPERGDISPVEFIPLAEETGLIVPLGQWVLKAACEQMQQWHAAGHEKFSVSVNCSAVQFTRGNMEREIEAALLSSGLDASYLEIELTESLLMQDIDAGIASLERMKTLGVQVAIDDFGTGFSSLSYLKSLPADKLKIDRQFITDLASDAGDKAIVQAITSLSHDLGLTVVAEGVETGEQLDVLRRLECDEAQGYLFGKPLTADELIAWLDQKSSNDGHYGIDGLDSWQDEAA